MSRTIIVMETYIVFRRAPDEWCQTADGFDVVRYNFGLSFNYDIDQRISTLKVGNQGLYGDPGINRFDTSDRFGPVRCSQIR